MKLAIIGHGFVGRAVDHGFQRHVTKKLIDPLYKTNIPNDLVQFDPDVVFVCVPTPMGSDGVIDATIISRVMGELAALPQTLVIVKSTVTPDVLDKLDSLHPRMVYNPEFLSERNALHDFVNPPMMIYGGKQKDVEFAKEVFEKHSICNPCPVFEVDFKTASLVKYCINSFMASKVTFFNGMRDILDNSGAGVGWDFFTHIVSQDKRVGATHMQVPGPDGKYGFGGACFTKDTAALANYARKIEVPHEQLEATIVLNNAVRSQYELDDRERAQNVTHKGGWRVKL